MTSLPVVGRITFDLDGERVVVAPFTKADMDAVLAADGWDALMIFARLIEEPADATETRGAPWVGRALRAWQDEVDTLMARLSEPLNRAARRRQN